MKIFLKYRYNLRNGKNLCMLQHIGLTEMYRARIDYFLPVIGNALMLHQHMRAPRRGPNKPCLQLSSINDIPRVVCLCNMWQPRSTQQGQPVKERMSQQIAPGSTIQLYADKYWDPLLNPNAPNECLFTSPDVHNLRLNVLTAAIYPPFCL